MGASLTNDISMGYPLSYFNFNPPTNLTNIPAYSQSFMQDGYSFTIIHFYEKKTTTIYLIKMHGLPIESFKKNENIQFRFIFHFCYDQENSKNKNNLFSFKTSAIFSYNYPFIFIPNLAFPLKIGVKYVDDESDFTAFSTLKNTIKIPFQLIPKAYDLLSSYLSASLAQLLKILSLENKNENDIYNLDQNDKLSPEINEQEIQQIEHKKIISQKELRILQENFSLNDTNQVPYVGIDNLGLTCYISAALHFLSSVTPFVELLLNTKAKKNSTSYELQKIFVQLKMASIVAARERKRKNTENLDKKNPKTKKQIKKKSKTNENENKNDTNKEIITINLDEKFDKNNKNKTNNENKTSKDKNEKETKINNDNKNEKENKINNENENENKINNDNENENENKINNENENENKINNDNENENENKINNDNENKSINDDNKQTTLIINDDKTKKNTKEKENDNKNNKEDADNKKKEEEEEEEEEDMYEEFIIPINSCGAHFSSISILKFVSSFGKKLDELVFNEQDTHEFITILFDKIDSELGKEFAEKRKRIFGVTLINIIRCKNIDYGSEIEEELNDISLPIIGNCSSITKSLDKITSKEQMKGDNMWDTGDSKLGKQEVIRYMKFKKLPPFLTFHLMRYAQNEYTLSCEQLNSYFECPDIIDMKKYILKKLSNKNLDNNNDNNNNDDNNVNNHISKISIDDNILEDLDENLDDIDNSNETRYKLMAIIAHRGSLHSGHYVSYISPNVNNHWFLFNDSFVSESSLKEVQETYGKSATSTLFGISSIFHQSNDFYSYLVGYVRLDYIKRIKYGITAPIGLVPNALVMKYSVLILDLSRVSDNTDDVSHSLSNSDSDENLNSSKKIHKPIYGQGEKVEWSDANETIENLIISSDIISPKNTEISNDNDNSKLTNQKFKHQFFNNHHVFISYPETRQLFGPIQTNLKATDFIISGRLSQFLITPKIDDPVFVCKKKEVISVESSQNVFKNYNNDYLIKYEKKIITDPCYEYPIGSIITLLPREPFSLLIKNFEYQVTRSTSYEEIQHKLAQSVLQIQQKNDDQNAHNFTPTQNPTSDDDFDLNCLSLDNSDTPDTLASRIILYHTVSPLRPRLFSSARKLKNYGKLDFKILPHPATANSIDMFTSLSIVIVDLNYTVRHFSGLWLPRNDTIKRLFEWSEKVSHKMSQKDNQNCGFVISTTCRNRIQTILDRSDDIDFLNDVRIDLLKTDFPSEIEDYEKVISKFGMAPIEVRTVLYEPLSKQFNSLGFFYFSKNDTYDSLLRKIVKAQKNLKEVLTKNISIETQNGFFRGSKPKIETSVYNSLVNIATNPNFRNQRPILTVQIHKKMVWP